MGGKGEREREGEIETGTTPAASERKSNCTQEGHCVCVSAGMWRDVEGCVL